MGNQSKNTRRRVCVKDLREGDRVDGMSCPYLSNTDKYPWSECEYWVVQEVTQAFPPHGSVDVWFHTVVVKHRHDQVLVVDGNAYEEGE